MRSITRTNLEKVLNLPPQKLKYYFNSYGNIGTYLRGRKRYISIDYAKRIAIRFQHLSNKKIEDILLELDNYHL
jgi:hypothetical protein